LAHELAHVKNRDILISSVAAAVAMGITLLATFAMWGGALFGGNDRDGGNLLGVIATALLAPIAAGLLQASLSRSREFQADASGAALLDDGEPLARALEKIEAYVKQRPMDINPAQAQAYIVNPLSGRKMEFANLWRSHPPTAERVRRLRESPT
jgi:heat shock protein HtpX